MQTIESLTELLRMAHEQIDTEVAKNAELCLNNAEVRIAELEKEKELNKRVAKMFNDSPNLEFADFKEYFPDDFKAHNLEQARKGFWLGFESARCHPDEMNILMQWEETKVFNEAQELKE